MSPPKFRAPASKTTLYGFASSFAWTSPILQESDPESNRQLHPVNVVIRHLFSSSDGCRPGIKAEAGPCPDVVDTGFVVRRLRAA
jgi:flagellar motor component MotA